MNTFDINKNHFTLFIIIVFISIFFLLINPFNIQSKEQYFLIEFSYGMLILISVISNLIFTGTGILIYIIFSIVALTLTSIKLTNICFIIAIPIFIIVQITLLKVFDKFYKDKHSLFLNSEKLKEQIKTKNSDLNSLFKKKQSFDNQIKNFYKLRKYISKINLSLSRDHLHEIILDFVNKNISNGDIYSLAILKNNNNLQITNFIVKENTNNILLKPNQSDMFNEWVIRYRSPLKSNNINEDYRFQLTQNEHLIYKKTKSIISSPLISDDKPMGIIRIDSKKTNEFHLNDFRLLVIIANISALSIKNAELFQETQKLSITDGLTDLYLSSYLTEEIQKHININKNTNNSKTSAFLMMDLDFFKKINDQYGHVIGDNVLVHTSKIIKKNSIKNSIPSRYGGEEFALFIKDTSVENVLIIAEKIRKEIQEKKIFVRRKTIHVTISIGISFLPKDCNDPYSLINIADARLYEAKKTGKNKIVY